MSWRRSPSASGSATTRPPAAITRLSASATWTSPAGVGLRLAERREHLWAEHVAGRHREAAGYLIGRRLLQHPLDGDHAIALLSDDDPVSLDGFVGTVSTPIVATTSPV